MSCVKSDVHAEVGDDGGDCSTARGPGTHASSYCLLEPWQTSTASSRLGADIPSSESSPSSISCLSYSLLGAP